VVHGLGIALLSVARNMRHQPSSKRLVEPSGEDSLAHMTVLVRAAVILVCVVCARYRGPRVPPYC
jgi:hypothetical protein